MKSIILTLILVLGFIFHSESVFSQNKWWQREIPTPSENQMVNPNYLEKKRELEKTLDDINEMYEQKQRQQFLGHSTKAADEYLQHLGKKMNTLEYELSKIPMYITKTNTPTYRTNENQTTKNEINVYNTQPNVVLEGRSDDKEVLMSGGDNLKAKIQLDELNKYLQVKSFTNDEKISYYEAFIKDWPNTNASMEAEDIIFSLRNYIGIPIQLNSALFKELVWDYDNNPDEFVYKGKLPFIINFCADWNNVCQKNYSIFEDLAKEFQGKLLIYEVDISKENKIKMKLNIKMIPYTIFGKVNQKPISKIGIKNKDEFVTIIYNDLLSE